MSKLRHNHKRAMGGVVDKDPSPKDVYDGQESNVVKEADDREERKHGGRAKKREEHKDGGHVEGGKSRLRLDRPGRKMGGRVGADKSPLSSAARTEGRSDTKQSDV